MLDDVERRAFLVQPAREDPLPAPVGLGNVELDERPGQPFILPRRAGIAGAQTDHRIAHADRLAGLERDIADDAVALVEQPEHRDSLAHRGHPRHRLDRPGHVDGHGIGTVDRLVTVAGAPVAACAQRHHSEKEKARSQDYSGFHA